MKDKLNHRRFVKNARNVLFFSLLATASAFASVQLQQVGDQIISNASFDGATPVYTGTGTLLYSKPIDWACPSYHNSPQGSYCGYSSGKIYLTPYRTSNRLQPTGYWYQRVYLSAGTYAIEGVFSAGGYRDGRQGVVVTIGPGGPTGTHPQALSFMSNEPDGVKSSSWQVNVAGYYYITVATTGVPQLLSSNRNSTIAVDSLTMTYTSN